MRKLLLAFAFLFCVSLAGAKQIMQSKFDVDFYGFIKTAAQYTTGSTTLNEYNGAVTSENKDTRQFRLTAKETRFGFNIKAGENISGKIEVDFYGFAGGSANDSRIRHAYVNLHHNNWDFLFGQTWHLTPLILPFTNDAFFMGQKGALWMRIPQIRVTHTFNDMWQAAIAVTRATTTLVDGTATNEGRPGVEANITAKVNGMKFILGGAVSRMRDPSNTDRHGDIYVVDFGYEIPFSIFILRGQIWAGQNLASFLGSVGQVGYKDNPTNPEVRAYGGFASLKIKPWEKVWFNANAGIDSPVNSDIPVGGIYQNMMASTGINVLVLDKITLSFEAGPMATWYKGTGAGGADNKMTILRYEFSAKFPF